MQAIMRIPLISFVLFALSTNMLFAHPYLPIEEGVSIVADYSFEVETDKKEFKIADTKGTIHTHAQNWVDKAGKSYLELRSSYEGIPFMKEEAVSYRREEKGNVYVGYEKNGQFQETIELPSDVHVGSSWAYHDGVVSRRTVTAISSVKLAQGEELHNCLEVTRVTEAAQSLVGLVDKTWYCPNRGAVKTVFHQPTPVGPYKTETLQRSYRKK